MLLSCTLLTVTCAVLPQYLRCVWQPSCMQSIQAPAVLRGCQAVGSGAAQVSRRESHALYCHDDCVALPSAFGSLRLVVVLLVMCTCTHTWRAHAYLLPQDYSFSWMAQTVHIFLQACDAGSHRSLVGFCRYPAYALPYAIHMRVLPWESCLGSTLHSMCARAIQNLLRLAQCRQPLQPGSKGFNRTEVGNAGAVRLPHGCIDRTSRARVKLSYSAGLLCAQPLHRRLLVGVYLACTW